MRVPATRSKYGATPVVIDGVRFASKAEGRRYRELVLLEKAGEIRDLVLQPALDLAVHRLPLTTNARASLIGQYRGDFRYERHISGTWQLTIEDVKGMDTPLSAWKRRHVAAQYGITVEIVR